MVFFEHICFRYLQFSSHHARFQKPTIANTLHNRENPLSSRSDKPEAKCVAFIVLPYVRGTSEKIQRLLNKYMRMGYSMALKF